LAVNVVGNGIPSATSLPLSATYLPGLLRGGYCSYLGITSPPIPISSASAAVDLTIPIAVTSGIVQILGVFDPKGLYCNHTQPLGSFYPMTSANDGSAILFELGRAPVTLVSDTVATITDSYSALSASNQLDRQADCLNSLGKALSGFSYPAVSDSYTTGSSIPSLSPTYTGDAPTQFTVSPKLPAGLSLAPLSGVLSGTPTNVTSLTAYTVTATNLYGSANTTINILIQAPVPTPTPRPVPCQPNVTNITVSSDQTELIVTGSNLACVTTATLSGPLNPNASLILFSQTDTQLILQFQTNWNAGNGDTVTLTLN
jgi:hypothetical protein